MNILISACLLGLRCRYDGKDKNFLEGIDKLMKNHILIPICPEQMGGLSTPRDPAERVGNKVITRAGKDVTEEYVKGAEESLKLARLYDCKVAILKEKSPSCGSGKIYDGSFSKTLIDGNGVTAELLIENGIKVIGEGDILEGFALKHPQGTVSLDPNN